ncbi:MAG: hypothetical protein RIC14_03195 [Filomicrobium sp.]
MGREKATSEKYIRPVVRAAAEVVPRARKRVPRLAAPIEAHVARFDAPVRRELRKLIRHSDRFADLALVFPGAAFAIASRRGSQATRDKVVDLVISGAPLKSIARKLELPNWLRKLPPEAFEAPLGPVPNTELFNRRVASRLPQNISQSAFWLETVSFAAEAANEDFAIWLAEQPIFEDRAEPRRLFAVLAAYAWFSGQGHPAKDLIIVPWRPEIAFDTALCAAKSWFNRLRLILQLEHGTLTDSWLEEGVVNGYSFVPLLDRDDLLSEAQAMQNCADQYAERLAREKCRLYSIRRKGINIATLEIGPHHRENGVLAINQLKARHNMPASIEVWQAAHSWMAQQSGLKRLQPIVSPERPFNEKAWREMMAPYRKEKNGAGWMPPRLTQSSFSRLDMDMCDLAKRAGVTSWLFT